MRVKLLQRESRNAFLKDVSFNVARSTCLEMSSSKVGICETMQKVLEESDMKDKILGKLNQEVSIMSDSAPAQRLANRMFSERSKNRSIKFPWLLSSINNTK